MNRKAIALWLLVAAAGLAGCSGREVYKDPAAEVEDRVEDLLGRMTLEEKVMQVTQWTYGKNMNVNNVESETKAVSPMIGSLLYRSTSPAYYNRIQRKAVEESRLGIPILCGFDVIHGYRTIFPIPLGQACSWNEALVGESCRIAARESRLSGVHWTFSPMVDVARDARWGRVSEGYGEDPYLNGMMGVAAVKGYQGDDLTADGAIAACLKHFVGYAYSDGGRDYHYTEISPQTLWDTALPPFEMGVKAGAATVMSAFNDISGVPASANRYTMTDILRGMWGFDGLVVSDWDAVKQLVAQGVAADRAEAAAKAITAGLDMDMVDDVYRENLEALVESGRVPEKVLDEAVRRILRVKFRLGLFEKPYIEELPDEQRYLSIEARAAARELAAESMVLLKNSGATLPVAGDVRRIALMGPMADNRADLMGSWWGQGEAGDVVTILEGVKAEFAGKARIDYVKGCDFDGEDRSGFARAAAAARAADPGGVRARNGPPGAARRGAALVGAARGRARHRARGRRAGRDLAAGNRGRQRRRAAAFGKGQPLGASGHHLSGLRRAAARLLQPAAGRASQVGALPESPARADVSVRLRAELYDFRIRAAAARPRDPAPRRTADGRGGGVELRGDGRQGDRDVVRLGPDGFHFASGARAEAFREAVHSGGRKPRVPLRDRSRARSVVPRPHGKAAVGERRVLSARERPESEIRTDLIGFL